MDRTIYLGIAGLSRNRFIRTLSTHGRTAADRQEKTLKLLHIDSSPLGTQSVSRELTRRTVAQWQDSHPGTVVEYLDLAADAPST